MAADPRRISMPPARGRRKPGSGVDAATVKLPEYDVRIVPDATAPATAWKSSEKVVEKIPENGAV